MIKSLKFLLSINWFFLVLFLIILYYYFNLKFFNDSFFDIFINKYFIINVGFYQY